MIVKANIFSAVVIFFIFGCATDYKRAPYGGPDDRVNPVIISTSIPHNSLNIEKNKSIKIDFSKFIDRNSAKNALSISPRSAFSASRHIWYDKSLKIDFKDLSDNTTVVITINPSLKDTRNNPLKDSYSLAFSTGDRIEKKQVTGRIKGVINKNTIVEPDYSSIRINLYAASPDQLIDFERADPEYSAGVSSELVFQLNNISSGLYKLVAFTDRDADSKPDLDSEMIAFSEKFVDLSENDSLNYEFTMGQNDVVSPFIKKTGLAGSRILKLEFSEAINSDTGIVDSLFLNGRSLEFDEYPVNEKFCYISTASDIETGDEILIKLKRIQDDFGNSIEKELMTKSHTVTDIFKRPDFGVKNQIPKKTAVDSKLNIQTNDFYNDSVTVTVLNYEDSVRTELKRNEEMIPYLYRTDLSDHSINPGSYELSVAKSTHKPERFRIEITEARGSGSISGKISDTEMNLYMLILKCIETNAYKIKRIADDKFDITLRPGRYLCVAYKDEHGKGVFGHNIVKDELEKAEFYRDTVLVRKNWESTDIDFNFDN
ncbi:MAG: Ig-like domain-containing protein [Candidatus Delongbacteria bacterium]